ncbi:MAG: cytidylate kinase family protein, partial [Eubacteriales bacterium]|nr:cytidylate kinase family protein [Eubacteriales bacterium]
FVYADIEARIERCFERRRPEEEPLNREQMRKQILRVDKNRARYYEFYTGERWGDPKAYDLCINTSTESIKELCKKLQAFIEA